MVVLSIEMEVFTIQVPTMKFTGLQQVPFGKYRLRRLAIKISVRVRRLNILFGLGKGYFYMGNYQL
jgi:hypothetical protein